MPCTREKNILLHCVLRDKIIQNCLKIDTTHLYNNDLLLRQKHKKIECLGLWYNNKKKKKDIDMMYPSQRMHFLLDV